MNLYKHDAQQLPGTLDEYFHVMSAENLSKQGITQIKIGSRLKIVDITWNSAILSLNFFFNALQKG